MVTAGFIDGFYFIAGREEGEEHRVVVDPPGDFAAGDIVGHGHQHISRLRGRKLTGRTISEACHPGCSGSYFHGRKPFGEQQTVRLELHKKTQEKARIAACPGITFEAGSIDYPVYIIIPIKGIGSPRPDSHLDEVVGKRRMYAEAT